MVISTRLKGITRGKGIKRKCKFCAYFLGIVKKASRKIPRDRKKLELSFGGVCLGVSLECRTQGPGLDVLPSSD